MFLNKNRCAKIFAMVCVIGLSNWVGGCATLFGKKDPPKEEPKFIVRTDAASIEVGKLRFEVTCKRCHDPYSTKQIVPAPSSVP